MAGMFFYKKPLKSEINSFCIWTLNNSAANTVWTPVKAGMLAKTLKPATAWRPTAVETIGTSQRQQQKGDPQQQGCQK
jgi:hypothetical protein